MECMKLFGHKPPKKYAHLIMNHRTFWDYYYRLLGLSVNLFEWKNIPDTIDPRFLELTLIERGYAVYFNDEVLGDLALPCRIGTPLNVYRIPVRRTAYAVNGYTKELTIENSVMIFNNYLHTPSVETILLFAGRLTEIERTIDVNVKAQKTPVTILCDPQQEFTFKNFYNKVSENEPVIIGNVQGFSLDSVKVLNTVSPYVGDKLNILKRQIWNEALTFLGIENVSSDKKERLVSDEVETNLGAVAAQRYTLLNSRREAAEKINKMFGTNIEVNFRAETRTEERIADLPENEYNGYREEVE